MRRCRRLPNAKVLEFDQCEGRSLPSVVFVLNGNGYGAAMPDALIAKAAQVLREVGHRTIPLSTPALSTPGAIYGVARQMASLSRGQPIGIVGFSSGGSLAERLAGVKSLRVRAVLAYYSPPDLRDYLAFHGNDSYSRYVVEHGRFTRRAINLLSGPIHTSAHVVAAFGLHDRNVEAVESTASFQRDFPGGQVYTYPGPHGVSINASPTALEDFLAHL